MSERAEAAGFVGEGALERHLAGQLTAALARPDEAATRDALAAAGEVWREIAPRDALEKLLAVQMIAGHEAALDGYARARALGQAGQAAPGAAPETDRARRAELRLAARLSAIFARQAALLTRRRAQAERAREAAERRVDKARKRDAAQAAESPRGGVLVVPHDDPDRPWPDPEAVAAALARKEAEPRGRAMPGGRAAAPGGPGYLLVPGMASPEDWSRRARAHARRMADADRAKDK